MHLILIDCTSVNNTHRHYLCRGAAASNRTVKQIVSLILYHRVAFQMTINTHVRHFANAAQNSNSF